MLKIGGVLRIDEHVYKKIYDREGGCFKFAAITNEFSDSLRVKIKLPIDDSYIA